MGATRYYKVDTRHLTYAELWRISPGLGFVVGAILKTLMIPLKVSTIVPHVDEITLVDPGALDEDIRLALSAPASGWTGLGFRPAFHFTVPFQGSGMRSAAEVFLSGDECTVAQVAFVEKTNGIVTRREVVSFCFSRFDDGTFMGVSSARKRFNSPPEFDSRSLPGGSPAQLYESHGRRLQEGRHGRPARMTQDGLKALITLLNNRHVEYMARRGVYVPVESDRLSDGGPIQPR